MKVSHVKNSLHRYKVTGILQSLPGVFNLMPRTDYQPFVPLSAEELSSKAWGATAEQMQHAIDKVTATLKLPDEKRKSSDPAR